MPTLNTRQATLDDLEKVAALFDSYRQFYEQAPNLDLATRFLRERLTKQESVIFVAEKAGGEIVGFCQLYPSFCSVLAAPIFVVYDLFVAPADRRSGAGRALLTAAQEYAIAAGAARLDLTTAKTNIPAQTLYESLGWLRDQVFYTYNLAVIE